MFINSIVLYIIMKTCNKCKKTKPLNDFYRYKKSPDGFQYSCKKCVSELSKYYHNKSHEHNKQKMRENYQNNKENYILLAKKWKENNLERHREIVRKSVNKYYNSPEGKTKMLASINNYNKKRYNSDPEFKLLCLLRKRLHRIIKNKSKTKMSKEFLGCTLEECLKHLQKTAIDNGYVDFDINNYDGKEYHIDHIKPCASFDLSKENEQKKCFHYSNLQILTAEENLKKSDTIYK